MPSRRAAAVLLLLSACASWETATPDYAAPPSESPTPSSRHAPPLPVEPGEPGPPDAAASDRVAIASVQLLGDCPDPEEAKIVVGAARESESSQQSRSPGYRAQCEQSTVQLAVRSDRAGSFRIDAIRVLDGDRPRLAGTSTLRQPTYWQAESGVYQAWSGQVAAETDLKISYKLGELDLTQASKLVDPEFNTYLGPFVLELDVSIDGRRQTVRSMPFSREPILVIQT